MDRRELLSTFAGIFALKPVSTDQPDVESTETGSGRSNSEAETDTTVTLDIKLTTE